ncbi:MAG: hypothetical protein RJB38_2249 [Pseudomonadota bacterium]|jgi:hypothetical protein
MVRLPVLAQILRRRGQLSSWAILLLGAIGGFVGHSVWGAVTLSEGTRAAVFSQREVYSRARLEPPHYELQNAMVVHASVERTRRILTHFEIFAGMVPYIDRSVYDSSSGLLELAGGIWKYRLESRLRWRRENPDRWSFQVIGGHFLGLSGVMEFQPAGAGKTLVTFEGRLDDPSVKFPPRFIVEQGAQIIFAVTGRRVRSLVEDSSFEPQEAVNRASKALTPGSGNESKRTSLNPSGSPVPEPRRRLGQRED